MIKLYDGFVLTMIALVVVTVRDVIVFDGGVGIALKSGKIGESVTVDTVGVYEFPVTNADTVAVGTTMYWDDGAGEATTVEGTNTLIGRSWGVKAGATDGSVGIKIG